MFSFLNAELFKTIISLWLFFLLNTLNFDKLCINFWSVMFGVMKVVRDKKIAFSSKKEFKATNEPSQANNFQNNGFIFCGRSNYYHLGEYCLIMQRKLIKDLNHIN
ncbi:hypothetical protein BpHYR1_040816 [Brachionus plicatilis]|uniref:Uncharacterized protein n=1 Tax=Brachionus plicatilis TaxID=10195 RepID=A0A3M7REE0_BRAPC|nr:hypothetical protein BpHYR1_040816 [Brachionus plicatilis]